MFRTASTAFVLLSALPATAEVPRVLADVPPVHSLVARVMQGVGTPDLLLPPGASPHDFALRPSDAARLSDAEVVIWAGEGLTPWLHEPLETLAGGARTLELLETEGWTPLPPRSDAAFAHDEHGHDHGAGTPAEAGEHGEEHAHEHTHDEHAQDEEGHGAEGHEDHAEGDHAHGDHGQEKATEAAAHDGHAEDGHGHDDHADDHAQEGHAQEGHAQEGHAHEDQAHEDHAGHDAGDAHAHGDVDPHAWLDPEVAAVWMTHIAETLAEADPANAAAYAANAAAARAELDALAAEVEATLAPVRGARFIVPHDAYQYFETRFAIPASGATALTDAATPGPARIAELRAQVEAGEIACVLTDPQTSDEWARVLREGTLVRTAAVDPDGGSLGAGAELYPAILRNLATSLADCLG